MFSFQKLKHNVLALTAPILLATMSVGATTESGPSDVTRGYAPVNGLKMYYEIRGVSDGKNPPLVLLHGGGSTLDTSFGKVLSSFAKHRQVIAFDQQGHGRTADVDRPFSFEQSAD